MALLPALTPRLHPMPLHWTSTHTVCSIVAISPVPRTPTNACEHIEVYRPRVWCASAPRWRNQGGWPTPRQGIVRPPHAHLTTRRSTRTSAPCACCNSALPMQTSLSCALPSSIRATHIHWRCSRMRVSSAAPGMASIGCSVRCDACSKLPLSFDGRSCHFHCSRCRCLRAICERRPIDGRARLRRRHREADRLGMHGQENGRASDSYHRTFGRILWS